jgi:WD40 repeat protein
MWRRLNQSKRMPNLGVRLAWAQGVVSRRAFLCGAVAYATVGSAALVQAAEDATAKPPVREIEIRDSTCLAFSPDGKTLAIGTYQWSDEPNLGLWDLRSGQRLVEYKGHSMGVRGVAFTPDGKTLASGGDDRVLRFWDAATGKLLAANEQHESRIDSVCYSVHGKRLVTGESNFARLWDAEKRTLIKVFEHEDASLYGSAVLSPDGYLLAAGGDEDAYVWDTRSFKLVATLKGHRRSVCSLSFSPDGDLLATCGGDHEVRIWSRRDMSPRFTIKSATSAALSSNGKLAVTTFDASPIVLYDATTGRKRRELSHKQKKFLTHVVTFSPNGTIVASTTRSHVVLWDVEDSK